MEQLTQAEPWTFDPLGDGISSLSLLDNMGTDLDVVNDARKSFNQRSEEIGPREVKLIKYLIDHDHTSPLRGVVFKFGVKAPLFVARQWWKHVVASAVIEEQVGWNEVSFRYVELEPEFYTPPTFLSQSKSNRQASAEPLEAPWSHEALRTFDYTTLEAKLAYEALRGLGVSREQARMVLPVCTYTEWVWTVSLQSVLHFCGLRLGKGAQGEIQRYAKATELLIRPFVSTAITAWQEKNSKDV